MKVLILGASGIVGQHMRLCVPVGVEPVWVRKTADPITRGADVSYLHILRNLLEEIRPELVINLAGESNVEKVELDPRSYRDVNVEMPEAVARWCKANGSRMIQVSSQAVFRGNNPPYGPEPSTEVPVNRYGLQKKAAETRCLEHGASIVRLSFVLGIRPLPNVGRPNPLEQMIAGQAPQVYDRFFSPLMAWDAAELLWQAAETAKPGEIFHCGIPQRWTRHQIANLVNPGVKGCKHSDFTMAAPRPIDTTYDRRSVAIRMFDPNLIATVNGPDRAVEIALFLGIPSTQAVRKLRQGFGPLHVAVTEDFRGANPQTEAEYTAWYQKTEAYIWELSAYHDDPGFNYAGMCKGIADRLLSEANGKDYVVLTLGDGIGDMTLAFRRAGLNAWYHDLKDSRTATYARFRYWRQTGQVLPEQDKDCGFDAVVSVDFLEHVPDVEAWVRRIYAALVPGGLFFAQNAFNCGSGPDGSIPMHLACNDHWEQDWDPLLKQVGFEQLSSNWYRKI